MGLDRWYDTWLKWLRRKERHGFKELNYANLTWKCEVCRRERHDSKIDVISHPHTWGGSKGHSNVKYCNDNPHCQHMAENHDLFELRELLKQSTHSENVSKK